MNRLLATLNRRLDACYEAMELTWAIYQQDRKDDLKLHAYVVTLRRANRLWSIIKNLTPTS